MANNGYPLILLLVLPNSLSRFPSPSNHTHPTLVIMRLFHVPSNKHSSLLIPIYIILLQQLPVCGLLGGQLVVYVPLRLSALHQRVVVEWELFFGFKKVVTDVACAAEGLAEDWIHYYWDVFLVVVMATFISIFL